MRFLDHLCRTRKARVDDTKQVIAETEVVKAQLLRLTAELADYVADLRALTTTVALRRSKTEGTSP